MENNEIQKVVSIDLGFGSTKIAIFENTVLKKYFKEIPSVIKVMETEISAYMKSTLKENDVDKHIVQYEGNKYMVGGSALHVSVNKENVLDVVDFESFKVASVIVLKYFLDNLNLKDGMTGLRISLSMAYIQKSKEFKSHLVEKLGMSPDLIRLIPQGRGAWECIKKIGLNPLNPSAGLSTIENAIVMDYGFNTLDVCQIVNGEFYYQGVRAFEKQGSVRIADKLREIINNEYDISISLSRAREVLEHPKNMFESRGVVKDYSDILLTLKKEYVKETCVFMNKNFEDVLNATKNLIIVGGVGHIIMENYDIFKENFKHSEGFVLIPEDLVEYYNAIGGGLMEITPVTKG